MDILGGGALFFIPGNQIFMLYLKAELRAQSAQKGKKPLRVFLVMMMMYSWSFFFSDKRLGLCQDEIRNSDIFFFHL